MTATRGASLTAAVRMIDRVHGDATIVRTPSHPSRPAGLANADVHMIGIGHRPDRRHAASVDQTLLAGIKTQDDIFLVAADNLRIGSRRACQLPAFADLKFDIMDDG